MLKIIRALGALFLSLLMIILISWGYVLFETQIRLKNYPEFLNYKFYLVKNETSLKDISVGELVIIKKDTQIDRGDIVLYLSNDNDYVLSRVMSKSSSISVLLKKDNEDEELLTNSSVIVGKAVKKVKGASSIINILTNKILLLFLAISGLVLVVFSQHILNKPKQIT